MTRLMVAVALVLVLSSATHTVQAAAPESRVALVIGNSAYESAPLANPANDAIFIIVVVCWCWKFKPRSMRLH